jgi:hypothetical protein
MDDRKKDGLGRNFTKTRLLDRPWLMVCSVRFDLHLL